MIHLWYAVVDARAKDEKRLSGSKPMLKAPHVGADAVVDAGAKDEKRLSGSKPVLKASPVGADAVVDAGAKDEKRIDTFSRGVKI